ncbi:MAG: hypothetical protein ABUT20_44555 [Bacteroidota bacterium]
MLVDLHQQFDTLSLGESGFQREVIDALAGNAELITKYRQVYINWQTTQKECEGLKLQKQQFEKEADYNRFQYNELEEAAFKENELEDIDAGLRMLSNAEGIKSALSKTYYELEESDKPLVQQLKLLANQLHAYSGYHAALPAVLQRLQAAQIELKDIADEIDSISTNINYDPEKIEQLNDRLSLGYKLLKKHGVKTTNELLSIKNSLEEKLQAVLDIDAQINEKEKIAEKLFAEAKQLAAKISDARKKQSKPLEEKINKLLVQVGMPNARLKVDIKQEGALNS